MRHYLDSSVVLAWLLEGTRKLVSLEGAPEVGSSRLLWVEVSRVLHRALQTGRIDAVVAAEARHNFARFSAGLNRIRLTDTVLERASGPYPLVIRTMDALHLASAELWQRADAGQDRPVELSIWSLDRQMNLCAAQLGFSTPLLESS